MPPNGASAVRLHRILLALLFMLLLFIGIFGTGYRAFAQTQVRLESSISAAWIPGFGQADIDGSCAVDYAGLIKVRCRRLFPDASEPRRNARAAPADQSGVPFTSCAIASWRLRDLIGKTRGFLAARQRRLRPVLQGPVNAGASASGRLNEQQVGWVDALASRTGRLEHLQHQLFTAGDSREPELAGIRGALIGSLFTLLVTLAAVVPHRRRRGDLSRGIRAEEPLDRPDRGQRQQPRRGAVDRVRPARAGGLHQLLRPAALGAAGRRSGADADDPADHHHRHPRRAARPCRPRSARRRWASAPRTMQVVIHHVLPLALPGILTGTIIGMAQALGETAPLLMIGMVAFIVDVPQARLPTRPRRCRYRSTCGPTARSGRSWNAPPPRSWCCSAS